MAASRFEPSDVTGIHGEVILPNGKRIQLLVSDDSEKAVRVIRGVDSLFIYFVFIPEVIHETMLVLHSIDIFEEALMQLCESVYNNDENFK